MTKNKNNIPQSKTVQDLDTKRAKSRASSAKHRKKKRRTVNKPTVTLREIPKAPEFPKEKTKPSYSVYDRDAVLEHVDDISRELGVRLTLRVIASRRRELGSLDEKITQAQATVDALKARKTELAYYKAKEAHACDLLRKLAAEKDLTSRRQKEAYVESEEEEEEEAYVESEEEDSEEEEDESDSDDEKNESATVAATMDESGTAAEELAASAEASRVAKASRARVAKELAEMAEGEGGKKDDRGNDSDDGLSKKLNKTSL
jgi:hypothetical protein